jgi:hypothetical protein
MTPGSLGASFTTHDLLALIEIQDDRQARSFIFPRNFQKRVSCDDRNDAEVQTLRHPAFLPVL